jgi:hypothetical protein
MQRNFIAALLIGVCASILGSTDTIAQFLLQGIVATGGTPPACSNSFDFSDPCNSQYIFILAEPFQ